MSDLAWVTQSQVASLGLLKSATFTLTDAQIKALPTTPVVIIPATEVLNYEGFPSQIPIIISATATVDATSGAYTNVTANGFLVLAYGSDWSSTIGRTITQGDVADAPVDSYVHITTNAEKVIYNFNILGDGGFATDGLQDNAVVIAMSNSGGDLTGGNIANSLTVDVLYWIKTL